MGYKEKLVDAVYENMKKVPIKVTVRKQGKTRGRPSTKEKMIAQFVNWVLNQPEFKKVLDDMLKMYTEPVIFYDK